MSKLAIILVNYNSYDDTVECVKSLKKIKNNAFDIIIVDNASNDRQMIKQDSYLNSNATVILAEYNGGFSYGNNIGIKYALRNGAEYCLLLNNDTVVEENFIDKLLACAVGKNDCGIVTGQSRYYFQRDKANFRGGEFNYKLGGPQYFNVEDESVIREEITFATGCLMMIPKTAINRVGLLDESYFMYGEDTDYCMRIIEAGLKIYYCDDAIIYHKISASSGKGSPFQNYYILRNGLYIIEKYGSNKLYAFFRQIYLSIKFTIKKEYSWTPVRRAWGDFILRKKGRSVFY